MKNHNAFTLIELLVVISIIALLVSILMPALNIARKQATGAACLANQKTLAMAWVMYYDDNDDRIAFGNTSDWNDIKPWAYYPGSAPGMETKYESIRNGTLYPYIETVETYHCPGDKRCNKIAGSYPGSDIIGGYRSYSIPGGLFGTLSSGRPIDVVYGFVPHRKASGIKQTSEKYVFIEEADARGGNMESWLIHPATGGTNGSWWDPLAIWHNDASTLGFCDGHAELHRWLDTTTFDMSSTQEVFYPDAGGDDLAYMLRGFAFKQLAP